MTQQHFGGAPGRSVIAALRRGLRGGCPACHDGPLYRAYLKVNDACPACGEALHHHRADDAPPYFTMMIVGHMIVPAALMLERLAAPPTWQHFTLWLPLTLLLVLWLLPRVKGALVCLQWALRMHGFDQPSR